MASGEATITVKVDMEASLADRRLIEIIMRYDRLRRCETVDQHQRASGNVAIGVQYVEDLGHLLRALGVALPSL